MLHSLEVTYKLCVYEYHVLEGVGAQWIYCRCGRWVHEDCVEGTVRSGQQGTTRILDKFTE